MRLTAIHVTDGLPVLLPLLYYNIRLNSRWTLESNVTIQAGLLPWGQALDPLFPKQVDVILAADCAYLEESFPLLSKTLEDLMGEQTVLYFCYKKRRKRDRDCIKMIAKVFDVEPVEGAWEADGIWLFEARLRVSKLRDGGS